MVKIEDDAIIFSQPNEDNSFDPPQYHAFQLLEHIITDEDQNDRFAKPYGQPFSRLAFMEDLSGDYMVDYRFRSNAATLYNWGRQMWYKSAALCTDEAHQPSHLPRPDPNHYPRLDWAGPSFLVSIHRYKDNFYLAIYRKNDFIRGSHDSANYLVQPFVKLQLPRHPQKDLPQYCADQSLFKTSDEIESASSVTTDSCSGNSYEGAQVESDDDKESVEEQERKVEEEINSKEQEKDDELIVKYQVISSSIDSNGLLVIQWFGELWDESLDPVFIAIPYTALIGLISQHCSNDEESQNIENATQTVSYLDALPTDQWFRLSYIWRSEDPDRACHHSYTSLSADGLRFTESYTTINGTIRIIIHDFNRHLIRYQVSNSPLGGSLCKGDSAQRDKVEGDNDIDTQATSTGYRKVVFPSNNEHTGCIVTTADFRFNGDDHDWNAWVAPAHQNRPRKIIPIDRGNFDGTNLYSHRQEKFLHRFDFS
ncbi:uncharacterized protein L201_005353 [Kwoniella dendrophila CBS 6074]|uniref:Uncharacterized protein n=1 Tax=Kwoniella dendrophila CBS 6074 TaxID=1295534 RepID=A0AAX4K0Z9_9TREE